MGPPLRLVTPPLLGSDSAGSHSHSLSHSALPPLLPRSNMVVLKTDVSLELREQKPERPIL
jgi:hypothetical protein